MLVLHRKINESLVIGENIAVVVVDVKGSAAKLGVVAPPDVPIHRREVLDQIAAEGRGVGPGGKLAALWQANVAAEQQGRWWACVRKRDGAQCWVWRYTDASGETRVSCARTHGPLKADDFEWIAPAQWPVT